MASGCLLAICLSGNLSSLRIGRQTCFSPLKVGTQLKLPVLTLWLSFPCLVWQVLSACKGGKVGQCMKSPRVHPSSEGHTKSVRRGRIKDSVFWGLFQLDSHSRLVHRHCGDSNLETVWCTGLWNQNNNPLLHPHPLQTSMIAEQHGVGVNTWPYGKWWLALEIKIFTALFALHTKF